MRAYRHRRINSPLSSRWDDDRNAAPQDGIWPVTFSDLLLLLLTFFALRLSMSSFAEIDLQKVLRGKKEMISKPQTETPRTLTYTELLKETLLLKPLVKGETQESLQDINVPPDIKVENTSQGAKVLLGSDNFESGSAELSPLAVQAISRLAESLVGKDAELFIAGHTDDIPIQTPQFPSNWELSAARAIAVARIFMERGIKGAQISVVGYAHTKPLADNTSEEGRRLNRRVEIFVSERP